MKVALAALALTVAMAGGCSRSGDSGVPCADVGSRPAGAVTVSFDVVGETGEPLPGATVDLGAGPVAAGADGTIAVTLDAGPALAVVAAPGHLAEPVPVGLRAAAAGTVRVRLLSDKGGARIAVHSVGDVMLGRRYEAPASGTPLIAAGDPATGATNVVSFVRAAYSAADFRTLNLETAVTDREPTDAQLGKRFLIKTRPGALAGVKALGPSAVVLANNHVRDYLDPGITDTLGALGAASIPSVGASADTTLSAPLTTPVRGLSVGLAAWTTLDGTSVNDAWPKDGPPVPAGLPPSEAGVWQPRSWSFDGTVLTVPPADRRIGSAWDLFKSAERAGIPTDEDARGWTSITGVYPELQDLVIRRGHGGALRWDPTASPAALADLAARSDVVIAQVHTGYQFVEAPAAEVQALAHAAIDGGADIVVCHHPHVLQAFEWYKDKLIAYSLGNFVFDQDLLPTFGSVILRTVWERHALVEARLVPVEIVGYRPTPATDGGARLTLERTWEKSQLGAFTVRVNGRFFSVMTDPGAGSVPAHLAFEGETARLVRDAPAPVEQRLRLAPGSFAPTAFEGLIDPRLGLDGAGDPSILVGRDLFGWGRFEDELADGRNAGDTHWDGLGQCPKAVVFGDAATGAGFLRLRRGKSDKQVVEARPKARTAIGPHRFFRSGDPAPVPLDPPAIYSLHFKARRVGAGAGGASVKFETFHFDDSNLTENPSSAPVGSTELPVALDGDGWQETDIPLPSDLLGPNGDANAIDWRFILASTGAETALDVDDVMLVEWRPAAQMLGGFGRYDLVKNGTGSAQELVVRGWPEHR